MADEEKQSEVVREPQVSTVDLIKYGKQLYDQLGITAEKKIELKNGKRVDAKKFLEKSSIEPPPAVLNHIQLQDDPFSGNENNRRVAEDRLRKEALLKGETPAPIQRELTEQEKEDAADAALAAGLASVAPDQAQTAADVAPPAAAAVPPIPKFAVPSFNAAQTAADVKKSKEIAKAKENAKPAPGWKPNA